MPKAIDKRPTKLGVARVDSSAEGLRPNAGNEALGSVDAIDEHFGHHHDLLVIFVLYLIGLSGSIYTYYKVPRYRNRAFDITMILAHMRIAVTIPYAYYKLDEPQWYI